MNYDYKNLRPFKWFVLQNFPFIEADFDAITNWQLFCKLGEEINKVINSMNLTGEQVESLTNAFNSLEAYVNNYFDNLDIQDEVDNKLDEMAEGGELAELISQYLESQAIIGFNTNTDLKNATNLANGSFARTYGKNTYNDGKGAFYKIRETINTDVPDDDNIIALTNYPTLVAEKMPDFNIESVNNKINEISRNNKYIAYIFCDTEERQSESYVSEFLERCCNSGFKESQMTIHIKSDGSLQEDSTKFMNYNEIANNLNIPITSVKFHGNYTATNYINTILNTLQYFPNATTVFIFNEQIEDVVNNGLSYPNLIKTQFPNINNVGITCSYAQGFFGNSLTENNLNQIENSYDILGVNLYPSCTTFIDSSYCNYENVINAFNKPQFIIPWKKDIWITESGVLPYWQFLEQPENYNINNLTDLTISVESQRLFLTALKNCNIAKKAIKIIPWYLESGMSDNEHKLFDILKNIILDR